MKFDACMLFWHSIGNCRELFWIPNVKRNQKIPKLVFEKQVLKWRQVTSKWRGALKKIEQPTFKNGFLKGFFGFSRLRKYLVNPFKVVHEIEKEIWRPKWRLNSQPINIHIYADWGQRRCFKTSFLTPTIIETKTYDA